MSRYISLHVPRSTEKATTLHRQIGILCNVLCVQIITWHFPDSNSHVTIIEDLRFPTGTIEIPVLECCQSHIDLINPAHALLPLALNCLRDREAKRPSTQDSAIVILN